MDVNQFIWWISFRYDVLNDYGILVVFFSLHVVVLFHSSSCIDNYDFTPNKSFRKQSYEQLSTWTTLSNSLINYLIVGQMQSSTGFLVSVEMILSQGYKEICTFFFLAPTKTKGKKKKKKKTVETRMQREKAKRKKTISWAVGTTTPVFSHTGKHMMTKQIPLLAPDNRWPEIVALLNDFWNKKKCVCNACKPNQWASNGICFTFPSNSRHQSKLNSN